MKSDKVAPPSVAAPVAIHQVEAARTWYLPVACHEHHKVLHYCRAGLKRGVAVGTVAAAAAILPAEVVRTSCLLATYSVLRHSSGKVHWTGLAEAGDHRPEAGRT